MQFRSLSHIQQRFRTHHIKWIKAIGEYSPEAFVTQPTENNWSVGQVCNHLIETSFSILDEIVPECLAKTAQKGERMTFTGNAMYSLGMFPPLTRVKSNRPIPEQPGNPLVVKQDIEEIGKKMEETIKLLSAQSSSGRVHHFILGYLDAFNWVHFVEMHFHHHLRQKRRIDKHLQKNNLLTA